MLNPLPEGRLVELSYIGVAHWARAHAIAKRLMHMGIERLRKNEYQTIVLAVDHANNPARLLYDRLGFHCTDRRKAFIRSVAAPADRPGATISSGQPAPVSHS
jgi:ribosomal protein S18 acetylase RimI-like enzyme